ncbi:hypothetical protein ACFLYU_04420 [Candidatus Dependentiae bacterium]
MTCLKQDSAVKVFKKLALLLSFVCFSSPIFGAELITGDENAAEGQTFSFPIGEYAINTSGDYFYATAFSAGAKEFSISRVKRGETAFRPLAPEFISINGQSGQEDPLFDDGIKHLYLLENRRDRVIHTYPVLVTNNELDKIYVLDLSKYFGRLYNVNTDGECDKKVSQISLAAFDSIVDANLDPISQVDAIAADTVGHIFAAVAPNGGSFGDPGSAIALLRFITFQSTNKKSKEKEDKKIEGDLKGLEQGSTVGNSQLAAKTTKEDTKKNVKDFFIIKTFTQAKTPEKSKDAQDGSQDKQGEGAQKKVEQEKKSFDGTRQYNVALDRSSALVKIVSDLTSMQVSDMYWDSGLKRLFIALHVEAGAGIGDGCKALVLGKINDNGTLSLQNIAPDAVFVDQDEIVGAVGASAQVSLHKVRTMHSSNRLSYVVVLGGNGDVSSTKKNIYALPLVKNPKKVTHGTLANKNGLPEDLFVGSIIKKMNYRYFKDAATTNDEVLKSSDEAANVGAGQLDYDVSEIFVVGDAVFALVKPQDNNGQGNLYMSRALFDKNGKIKRWTKWQFVSSSTAPLFGASLDSAFGNFVLLSGDAQDNVKTVKRTLWSMGDENGVRDLSVVMGQEFQKEVAGIQGLFEFPYSSQGVPFGLENITMLVATGNKKVVLAELAKIDGGKLVRNTGDFSTGKEVFTGGQITKNFPVNGTRVITISGGVLDAIGPIEAATVTLQSTGTTVNNRLFVGGIGGVAVLVDDNGDGWTTGLGPNFAGLTDTMAFRTVGDFTFVRKLVQEGDYLFILTDDKLYRVDLTSESNDFVNGVLDSVEIANFTTVSGMCEYSAFSDFIVSGKLGVLATSCGLFRVGNDKDIQTGSLTDLGWTQVNIPSYSGPVKQLLAVSQSLRGQDVAKEDLNGVLYVLCSYCGKDVAQFNRFTVDYTAQVGDDTILPFPDYFVVDPKTGVGSYSYFVNYGIFRELFRDEGAMRYSSADKDLCISPFLRLLPPGLVSGALLPIVSSKTLSLSIENDSDIVRILRSSTGPIFVAGDFGLKVNE